MAEMMRLRYFGLLLFLLGGMSASAQSGRTDDDYLKVVQRFYSYLFSEKPATPEVCMRLFGEEVLAVEDVVFEKNSKLRRYNDSARLAQYFTYYNNAKSPAMYFTKIKEQSEDLTQGLTKEEMKQTVYSSGEIIDTGRGGSTLVKVTFRNKSYVHFALSEDTLSRILIKDIFLCNGASVNNSIIPEKPAFLEFKGKIKAKESYLIIRNLPDASSLSNGRVKEDDTFTYIPDCNNSWWKIVKAGKPEVSGYIPAEKISMEVRGKRR